MKRASGRSGAAATAAHWTRWFWTPKGERRASTAVEQVDYLDEYLQLLDYLDDLGQDGEVSRVEISSEYLPLIAKSGANDLARRSPVRFTARGLRIVFSPTVSRRSVHVHRYSGPS